MKFKLDKQDYPGYIIKAYENFFLSAGRLFSRDDEAQLVYIRKYLPPDKKAAILDAGCGNGKYLKLLHEMGYSNCFGVDLLDNAALAGFNYQRAAIENLPFKDGVFDFLFSNSVIYHLQKPEAAIEEFGRVLKKGGLLVFSSHTRYSLFTAWRKIKLALGASSVRHLEGAAFLGTGRYLQFLKKHGFEILRIDGYRLSFVFHPLYFKCVKFFNKRFSANLRAGRPKITRSFLLARIKSIIGYHFIIVSKRKNTSAAKAI